MSNYICREDAVDAFNRAVQDVGILDADDIETVFGMLSYADVVQVVHGRWIHYRCDMYECSVCQHIHTSFDSEECDANFCPNCGAKMDAQREE